MTNKTLNYVRCLCLLLSLSTVLLLAACGSIKPSQAASQNHPLVGQIWDVEARRLITRDELLRRATNARYLLLGETHDNEIHHRIQTEIVEALSARGAKTTLAMEQFDIEHQAALDRAVTVPNATTESIADAGQFNRKGWNWPMYEPLIAIALRNQLSVAAINLSRTETKRIIGQPQVIAQDPRFTALALDVTWNSLREDKLRNDLIAGHCGHAPENMLSGLVAAQRARDASMAEVLINRAPAIAILGHEHARKDIGVPIYLTARVPNEQTLSVGLIEVEQNLNNLSDYITQDRAQFDFVWFTPSAQREDPCLHMPKLTHPKISPSPT